MFLLTGVHTATSAHMIHIDAASLVEQSDLIVVGSMTGAELHRDSALIVGIFFTSYMRTS